MDRRVMHFPPELLTQIVDQVKALNGDNAEVIVCVVTGNDEESAPCIVSSIPPHCVNDFMAWHLEHHQSATVTEASSHGPN